MLEAIPKPRIRSESKAQADEKAQHTWEYVSILKRLATQLSGLRRGFEMASRDVCMGKIFNQTKTELRQLPLMLGKLTGGLTAVIGFTAAVISARRPGFIVRDILPSFLLGCAGIIIFIMSSRALSRRLSGHAEEASMPPVDSTPMNQIAWALFLLFAGIFLVCVYFFTG